MKKEAQLFYEYIGLSILLSLYLYPFSLKIDENPMCKQYTGIDEETQHESSVILRDPNENR